MAVITEQILSFNTLADLKLFTATIKKNRNKFIKIENNQLSFTHINTEAAAIESLKIFNKTIKNSLPSLIPKTTYQTKLIYNSPKLLKKIMNHQKNVTNDFKLMSALTETSEEYFKIILTNIFDSINFSLEDSLGDSNSDSDSSSYEEETHLKEKKELFEDEKFITSCLFTNRNQNALINRINWLKNHIIFSLSAFLDSDKRIEGLLANKTSVELELIALKPDILLSPTLIKLIDNLSLKQISILINKPSFLFSFKTLYYFINLSLKELDSIEDLIVKQSAKRYINPFTHLPYPLGDPKRHFYDYYETLIQKLLFKTTQTITGKKIKSVLFDKRVHLKQVLHCLEGDLLVEVVHREYDKIPLNKHKDPKKNTNHQIHLERLSLEKKYTESHVFTSVYYLIEDLFNYALMKTINHHIFKIVETVKFTTSKQVENVIYLHCNPLYYNEFFARHKNDLENIKDENVIKKIIIEEIDKTIINVCKIINGFLQEKIKLFINEKKGLKSQHLSESRLLSILQPEILVYQTKSLVLLKEHLNNQNIPPHFLTFVTTCLDACGEPDEYLNLSIMKEILKET